MTNNTNDFENVMDSVNNVPMPPLPVDGDRADLEAYLEEKRKALKACVPEGANEIIMAISLLLLMYLVSLSLMKMRA